MSDKSIVRFRKVFGVAYDRLEERRQEINDLNVFPVADGDTGDNMALTMRAVLDALDELEHRAKDPSRKEIVETVAHAALMGARGNSGVILSQIVRGAAEVLATPPGRLIDPPLVALALKNAARVAWTAVPNPAPGTMLTAIEAMADKLEIWAADELTPVTTPDEQNLVLAQMIREALQAGAAAVDASTDQLEQLSDAGVVDAGALGLVVILSGAAEGLGALGLPEIPHYEAARIERAHEKGSRYRYCTNFVVHGTDLVASEWVTELEALPGDSVLVVADRSALKVHVHTDDDQAAFGLFEGVGRVEIQEVTDMREQIAARVAATSERTSLADPAGGRSGALAIVAGAGIASLLLAEGVMVLDGGPTLNPSTEEILAAINGHPADEVVVLPNSKNVVLAAEQAAELATKPVAVAADCVSQQAAVVAAVEIDREASASENAARLAEVLEAIRVGSVAPAARDDAEGRFKKGDAVGFIADEPVAWGDAEVALHEVAGRLAAGAELLTVLRGDGAPPIRGELALNGVEIEVLDGGQPAYWWLLAAQ